MYTALERGVIEATDWGTLGMNNDLGYHKIAKYPLYPGFHSMPCAEVAVNLTKWNALSPDLKVIVRDPVRDFARDMVQRIAMEDINVAAKAKASGIELGRLGPEERTKFRQLAEQAWADWAKKSPAAKKVYDSQVAFLKKLASCSRSSAEADCQPDALGRGRAGAGPMSRMSCRLSTASRWGLATPGCFPRCRRAHGLRSRHALRIQRADHLGARHGDRASALGFIFGGAARLAAAQPHPIASVFRQGLRSARRARPLHGWDRSFLALFLFGPRCKSAIPSRGVRGDQRAGLGRSDPRVSETALVAGVALMLVQSCRTSEHGARNGPTPRHDRMSIEVQPADRQLITMLLLGLPLRLRHRACRVRYSRWRCSGQRP